MKLFLRIVIGLLLGLLIALFVLPARSTEPIEGLARVVDGDTLWVGAVKVRIWGIDAPEAKQTCGKVKWRCGAVATQALEHLVRGRVLECRKRGTSYDRVVARCTVGQIDIGGLMVLDGWAFDYTRYSGGAYAIAEKAARETRSGIWRDGPEGIVEPWVWRRR